jgi:hypothetical protein
LRSDPVGHRWPGGQFGPPLLERGLTVMEFLIALLVIFVIFMVAGWGWRKGRSGV